MVNVKEKSNARRILVGKPDTKRSLERPRHTWKNNIKMDLKETGHNNVDWNHLAQYRNMWRDLVNTLMYLVFKILRSYSNIC